MNENKSLFLEIAEVIDGHLSQRKEKANDSSSYSGRFRRFLRWLTPNGGTILLVAALIVTVQVWAKPLAGPTNAPGPSATTVNYQGRLANPDGTPVADNTYGMSFSLWDAATDGNLIWPATGPEDHPAVPVSEGLFSVGLGSKTSGGIPTNVWDGDRYLEIIVRGETLSPRELIRSVPIAGMALTALTVPDGAIGSNQVADEAITTEKVADGAIGSQQMAPTFFQAMGSGDFQVPSGTGSDDNLVAVELVVDFPVDATYLIFTTLMSRGQTDGRILAQLQDENGVNIGRGLVNSHPINGLAGTQTGSTTAVHQFSAGTHTLRLVVWGNGYVRNGTIITAIPLAQAP